MAASASTGQRRRAISYSPSCSTSTCQTPLAVLAVAHVVHVVAIHVGPIGAVSRTGFSCAAPMLIGLNRSTSGSTPPTTIVMGPQSAGNVGVLGDDILFLARIGLEVVQLVAAAPAATCSTARPPHPFTRLLAVLHHQRPIGQLCVSCPSAAAARLVPSNLADLRRRAARTDRSSVGSRSCTFGQGADIVVLPQRARRASE